MTIRWKFYEILKGVSGTPKGAPKLNVVATSLQVKSLQCVVVIVIDMPIVMVTITILIRTRRQVLMTPRFTLLRAIRTYMAAGVKAVVDGDATAPTANVDIVAN